jgi:hypothetical protein
MNLEVLMVFLSGFTAAVVVAVFAAAAFVGNGAVMSMVPLFPD